MGNLEDARKEMTKTREQLEEEKKISLSIRIKPLELDGKFGLQLETPLPSPHLSTYQVSTRMI